MRFLTNSNDEQFTKALPPIAFFQRLPLQAGDIVGANVITIIGADGGEGDIVQDDICYIAEIRAVRRETRPPVKRH